MTNIKHIERESLSDGSILTINKLGRDYSFNKLYNDDQAPDCHLGLNKTTAYKMLADEIQADVLELSSY